MMSFLKSPPNDDPATLSPVTTGDGFRLAMREFATGVAIVACGEGERRAGCTITALTSLSLSPPSLLISVDLGAATLAHLRECGAFAVNLLCARHESLAERFAGRSGVSGAARFEVGDWLTLVTGAPVLADALACLDCLVEEIVERHTHAIVIGAVQAVRRNGAEPALLHWRSQFGTLR